MPRFALLLMIYHYHVIIIRKWPIAAHTRPVWFISFKCLWYEEDTGICWGGAKSRTPSGSDNHHAGKISWSKSNLCLKYTVVVKVRGSVSPGRLTRKAAGWDFFNLCPVCIDVRVIKCSTECRDGVSLRSACCMHMVSKPLSLTCCQASNKHLHIVIGPSLWHHHRGRKGFGVLFRVV